MPAIYKKVKNGDALDVEAEKSRAGSMAIFSKAMSHNVPDDLFSPQWGTSVSPDVRPHVVFFRIGTADV